MCEFDKQPLRKGSPYEKICVLGVMRVVNKKGEDINTHLKPLKICLQIGEQFNNKFKTGYGINHIYFKHFNEIPKRFHSVINNEIDCEKTIINFLLFFLHDTKSHLEISVNTEIDIKPLLIRSPYGRLVLAEFDSYKKIDKNKKFKREHFYQILTFVPDRKILGVSVGFFKKDLEYLNNKPYTNDNHKELDSFDNAQLVERQ